MYTRSQARKKNTEDIKMASAKDKTPSNVDKVFIGTSDVDTAHDDVNVDDAAFTSKMSASKSMSKSKTDDTVDLSHGFAYGHSAETSSSTAEMMGAKSKISKSPYTAATTPSTFYSTTTPSAPSHGLGASMLPPPGHLIQSPASLSISVTTFTLNSFSGAANTEDKAEKWLESFLLYTDFKRMSADDSLRLFKLLLKDQPADWLKSLPDHKKSSFEAVTTAFNERYALTRVDRWRQTAEIWSRKQIYNELVDDYVASLQAAGNRVIMPENYLADAILQGLKPQLRLFVLHSGADTIPEILKVARVSEAAHLADQSATHMSDVNSKLDFVMQQQAETMKALKSIEQSNQRSASMSDPSILNKKVTFAQSAMSENEQQSERQYYRRESPARSVSPSERRNNGFHTSSMRSQSPVRYNSSANNSMSNGGRTSNQQRDARNVSANRQVWRQQRQWPMTPPTGMQPQGRQPSASAPYNTTFNGQSQYIDPLQQRMIQNCARCNYCGRHPLGKMYCLAANVQCFNCARIGHLAKVCRRASRTQSAMYQSIQ
jgi:hypothetical protein